jgi:hypothetical protein
MDTIKTVRDRLNSIKSQIAHIVQPKMGKSYFDSLRLLTLSQEKKVLEEKLAELKNNS